MNPQTEPPTQEEKQKQVDKGFFASVPRIIRTGYENLTATAKWIYVCLKDLCGENGTCYRALRTLSTEVGVSTGMLSESIRLLCEAGLITAEKKRRPDRPTAKEVWHISIVNIWKLNGEQHPTPKRSQSEQNGSSPEQSSQNVHTANNNVQRVNKTASNRSPDEPKRSHSETEEEPPKNDQLQERSVKNEGGVSSVVTLPSPPAEGFNHSSSSVNVPFSSGDDASTTQGGVTTSPASVEVSSEQETPNNANVNPEFFALSPVPTLNNAPLDGATECNETAEQSSYSHSPQHDTSSSPDAVGESEKEIAASAGLYEEYNQVAMNQCEVVNDGARTGEEKNVYPGKGGQNQDGQVSPDNGAVMENDTPMEVTVEMMMKWIKAIKDTSGNCAILPGKVLPREGALKKLLPLVRSQQDVEKLYAIKRAWHPTGPVYIVHLANDYVLAQFKEARLRQTQDTASEMQENGLPVDSEPGMTEREWREVCKDIQFADLGFACAQDEDTGRYFIGIFDSDETQIDIKRPRDWYYLDMEKLKKAWDYMHPVQEQTMVIVEEAQELPESDMAGGTCDALMNIILDWSPTLKIKRMGPKNGRYTVGIFFGNLDTQYFEVGGHAEWRRIKQEDTPMLQCAVHYGLSRVAVAV